MNSDSYFEISSQFMGAHIVCQDYALEYNSPELSYVVISDGCSTARHSEIGSQILCHLASHFIKFYYNQKVFDQCSLEMVYNLLKKSLLLKAKELLALYQIGPEALQATLLIAVATEKNCYIFAFGDGVIIQKFKEGKTVVDCIDFKGNVPFYLVNSEEKYKEFMQKEKSNITPGKEIKTFFIKDSIDPNKAPTVDVQINYGEFNAAYFSCFPKDNLISVTVCSDGINSYRNQEKQPIPLLNIYPLFVDFPNTKGEFTKRTMLFLKKSIEKNKWAHYDDISCGTIII